MEPTLPGKNSTGSLSRRGFLQATGYLGAGAAVLGLSACGGNDAANPTAAGGGKVGAFEIPDPKVSGFPEGQAKFRLIDSNDTKAPFWEAFFEAYKKKHPDIETKYDGLPWNRIEEVVPLGIRNGTAHDVIQLPVGTIPLAKAINEGWVSPLDDIIPDLANWKKRFEQTTFVEGVHVFDGKVYQVPVSTDQRYMAALHYNKQLMNDAGFDPQSEPLTWDTYREAARKVTKKGGGNAYGVVIEIAQADRLGIYVDYLARQAGSTNLGGIDAKTGEFNYHRPEIVEAIELLLALKKDGSVFPSSSSLTAPECWPRVVRGNAAMVSAGPWVTVEWEKEEKGFEFGVGAAPAPDQGSAVKLGYSAFGADSFVVYSKSKAKPVAGDVLDYVTSMEGQKRWAEIVGVGNPPMLEKARQAAAKKQSEQARKCAELASAMVVNPDALVVNPDIARVNQLQKAVTPSYGEVIQAAFVGKVDNLQKELKSLSDRSAKIRDEAITAAKKEGTTVSLEDWTFPNWDPNKDYLVDDYKGR